MRKLRYILAVSAFAVLALAVVLFGKIESESCMGIPVVSPDRFENYTLVENPDLNGQIVFNGEVAPVDVNTLTIYITQQVEKGTQPADLAGDLEVANGEHRLYFIKDEAFGNLYEAVGNNHSFRLFAVNTKKEYIEFKVVFTALPVLKINGGFLRDIEPGKPSYIGNIWLWDRIAGENNGYDVIHSEAYWHIRGNRQDKQSLKFSLFVGAEQNNLSFMKLGKDEDWILNPLSIDDTKIREKTTLDLWKQLQQYAEYPLDMSKGEYVELLHDGTYRGVWMLQRRVDRKYLNLGEGHILLKNLDWFDAQTVEDAYEITYSAYDEQYTTALMQQLFDKEIYDHINLENWIDVALYIQAADLKDNCYHKNMFFLFDMNSEDYQIYLLPWDTDMAFGMSWMYNNIAEDATEVLERLEYSKLKELYPELDKRMAQRWQQLRQTVYSTENILATAEKYHTYLGENSVVERDYLVWNYRCKGADSYDMFRNYVVERMEFLDGYYAQYN